MKISLEDGILIKNLSVKVVWCTKTVAWISRLGLETWKHRQSAKENPQDGYNNCPASCGSLAVQSGGEAKKGVDQLMRFCVKLPFSVQVCTG